MMYAAVFAGGMIAGALCVIALAYLGELADEWKREREEG